MRSASPSSLPPSTARARWLVELGVLVVMFFWAGNFIVVKGAIALLPPLGFTFSRYCVASVTLLLLLRWREGAIRLPTGDVAKVVLLGIVGFGFYQTLWPVALESIPAGDSALLIATTPVMTALLAMAVRADTPSVGKLLGVLVSFAGVAIIVGAGEGLELAASIVGDVLTLAAAACWAVYTVFGATILRRHSPLVTTTWAVVGGTVFMAPLGIAQMATADLSKAFVLPVLLAILYAGMLAAGFANVVVMEGVKLLGPTRITALQFLIPALAVAMAAIFLGEAVRPVQVVGGAIILAGVALLRRGSWRPSRRASASAVPEVTS